MNPESTRSVQIQTDSESRTMEVAATLGRRLQGGDLVALDGPLGSGKTCFVRGLARGMGIDVAEVSSPTFVLRQEYEGAGEISLTHIDAYRLADAADLETIGWSELMEAEDTIVAIEWAARIGAALPERRIDVALAHLDQSSRDIVMTVSADLVDRIAPLVDTAPQRCPACGQPVELTSDTMPFCSPRCRLVDLGRWFDGKYSVSRPIEEDDLTF